MANIHVLLQRRCDYPPYFCFPHSIFAFGLNLSNKNDNCGFVASKAKEILKLFAK